MSDEMAYYIVFTAIIVLINISVYIHVKHLIDKSSDEEIKKLKEEMLNEKKGKRDE